MVSKLDNALAFQQQALGLRAYRQQVLASNIANADTPHYKARDIDFSAALKNAVAGRGNGDLALAAATLKTGVDRARAAKDTKALSELSGLLDQIE